MYGRRITLLLAPVALALSAAASCTTSLPVNPNSNANEFAGSTGSGLAGTMGTAGSTGAGNMAGSGTLDASGMAGTLGIAGTTGAAGMDAGMDATGAAGTGMDAAMEAVPMLSFATDILPIIDANCHNCHQTGTDGNLNMQDSAAYMSLVGNGTGGAVKTNTNCMLPNAVTMRVTPGDPSHSLMYLKVTTADGTLKAANCGDSMPKGLAMLSSANTQKIHDWIQGGAKP